MGVWNSCTTGAWICMLQTAHLVIYLVYQPQSMIEIHIVFDVVGITSIKSRLWKRPPLEYGLIAGGFRLCACVKENVRHVLFLKCKQGKAHRCGCSWSSGHSLGKKAGYAAPGTVRLGFESLSFERPSLPSVEKSKCTCIALVRVLAWVQLCLSTSSLEKLLLIVRLLS